MKYWFHPEARVELLESVAYYELQQNRLGQRCIGKSQANGGSVGFQGFHWG